MDKLNFRTSGQIKIYDVYITEYGYASSVELPATTHICTNIPPIELNNRKGIFKTSQEVLSWMRRVQNATTN